jgi:Fic/DOC family
VPALEKITHEELVRIQNETVDSRFADEDYRSEQVYVGEQLDLRRQKIHYIAPKPGNVRSMMNGLLAGVDRLHAPEIEPVVAAAVASFGFVLIHPFSDGNGRIHRLLIHYMLSRAGFTPSGLIFPVSAVMLARRAEYDDCLQTFSAPLMRLLEYEEDDAGVVEVEGETAGFYRYFDATPMAEALYGWVERTIQEELRSELEFVVGFREARRAIENVVELPDRAANLFIKICLSNGGKLSGAKRKAHFSKLTEKEIRSMERAVNVHMRRLMRSGP